MEGSERDVVVQRGDVYAFGVLLYEMYTGQRAWYGMRHPQIIHTIAVLNKHPELPIDAPLDLRVRLMLQSFFTNCFLS